VTLVIGVPVKKRKNERSYFTILGTASGSDSVMNQRRCESTSLPKHNKVFIEMEGMHIVRICIEKVSMMKKDACKVSAMIQISAMIFFASLMTHQAASNREFLRFTKLSWVVANQPW
jgi:hypothetical protein